jgi:hypothetical protein
VRLQEFLERERVLLALAQADDERVAVSHQDAFGLSSSMFGDECSSGGVSDMLDLRPGKAVDSTQQG